MKKIKFRGLAIEDYTGKPITEKKFVYGNVWANEDNSYVIIGEYKDAKGMSNHYVVDPDSVAQFVGYDADGTVRKFMKVIFVIVKSWAIVSLFC